MDWIERLNRGQGILPLGQGTVEVLSWAYSKHLADNQPHRHTYFEVCQVGNYGAGIFTVQEQSHQIKPGDVFFARPGVVHQIVNTLPILMELRWVCFQWTPPDSDRKSEEADSLLRAFADSPVLVAADKDRRVTATWDALQSVAEGPLRLGDDAQRTALISALILALAQEGTGDILPTLPEPSGPDSGDLAARLAIRYIHDNLNRPLSLPEIAGFVCVSPRHLSRLFARFTGVSPATYISHARMDRARGLLRHSALAIKEVASAVGYPDVHHFTRVFTQHSGCPPGVFRHAPEPIGNDDDYNVPNLQKPGALV